MRTSKHQRQHLITKILETNTVTSQPHLVELLCDSGVEATQATVSRDLEELGAVKVRLPGGERAFVLPELPTQQVAPVDHLRRVLSEWVIDATPSANLVVLRTPPGCAHVVASALDRSGLDDLLGTVAGDDTVLLVVTAELGGAGFAEQLSRLVPINNTTAPAKRSVARTKQKGT